MLILISLSLITLIYSFFFNKYLYIYIHYKLLKYNILLLSRAA